MSKKRVRSICVWITLIGLILPGYLRSYSFQPETLSLHAPFSELITIAVVRDWKTKQGGSSREFIAKGKGFSVKGCDVLTAYDVIAEYERREAWDTSQSIEIGIGGKIYKGSLRHVGVYPLGLNLACIDIQPDQKGGKPPLTIFPLEDAIRSDAFAGNRYPLGVMDVGTPLINGLGNVVGITAPELSSQSLVVISSRNIKRFLVEVEKTPPEQSQAAFIMRRYMV